MGSLRITIPGDPIPKGRPRFRVFGRFVSVYTPAKTAKAEKVVIKQVEKILQDKKLPVLMGSIKIDFKFYLRCPKSLHRVRNPRGSELCTTKPDLDNLAKFYMDALNGLVWKDDNQIVLMTVEKWRAAQIEEPRTEILISSLANEWSEDV